MKTAALLLASSMLLSAQEGPLLATPERVTRADQRFQNWRKQWQLSLSEDWGQLGRYRAANAQLKAPMTGEDRVVFLGDSITDMWKLETSFPGKPYINRGIGGQTTPQLLLRFRADVIALKPKVVVILAGTNDLAGNTGPTSVEEIEANYASMAELAKVNGIRVVFSSVLPVNGYTEDAMDLFIGRPMAKILQLNAWLKAYCASHGCTYLDYATSMLDAKGYLKQELALDGLHPNAEGYKIMAPLALGAIRQALR